MRIWAKIICDQRIQNQTVREFNSLRSFSKEEIEDIVHTLCQELDLSRPVLLNKHFNEFLQFQRITFRAPDFMEPVSFDKFEIELLKEKKRN